MAGKNLTLKDQQILFRSGDKADGMFLVRKGELVVYLEQDGREVQLAKLPAGSIVGEMAFFDQKPRSASVKSGEQGTEVTLITPQDFGKLMKQIPKWFVSIMSALSSRLRQTNDKLSKIENQTNGTKGPYEDLIKYLHVLSLIVTRDGEKTEDKKWMVSQEAIVKTLEQIFKVESETFVKMMNALVNGKIVAKAKNNYGKDAYVTSRKSVFTEVAEFMQSFVGKNPEHLFYPESVLNMMSIMREIASGSAYDNTAITLESIKENAEGRGMDSSLFEESLSFFSQGIAGVDMSKAGDQVSFRVDVKTNQSTGVMLRLLFEFHKEALE